MPGLGACCDYTHRLEISLCNEGNIQEECLQMFANGVWGTIRPKYLNSRFKTHDDLENIDLESRGSDSRFKPLGSRTFFSTYIYIYAIIYIQ